MKSAAILIACALPLAACNKGPQVNEKNASVAEVAKKVREAGGEESFIRAGLWQSKVTIEKFEMPGMPPEMTQRMKTMMAQNQEHGSQHCLTPEDVKRPKEDFFAGKNNACRYDHFTMGGGKIDATLRCARQGVSQVMELTGTYSPESYRMRMRTHLEGAGPVGGMTMAMRVESTRIGQCPGGAG